MWTRRRFLTQSLALLGATGTALAFPGDVQEGAIPDGSASRGMITQETEQAIDKSLEVLGRMHKSGFTAEEIASSKTYINGSLPPRYETTPHPKVGVTGLVLVTRQ